MKKNTVYVRPVTRRTLDYGDLIETDTGLQWCVKCPDGYFQAVGRNYYGKTYATQVQELRDIMHDGNPFFDVVELPGVTISSDINPRGDI